MRQKTDQVFVTISHTYTPKNSLENHVVNELRKLRNLLFKDLKEAKKEISQSIERATVECMTTKRCKPLNKSYWSHTESCTCFRVNDVIQLAIHKVFIKTVN